jgi:hypothetical protein
MIRLEQQKNFRSAVTMAVEIEVFPLETPEHHYTRLRVRYLIDNRQVLEMESAIYPFMPEAPLVWLEKAIQTRRKELRARFGNPVSGEHLIYIEQTRLSKDDFADIQAELGTEAYPYPFMYDIEVLVNPDPEGLAFAGIGMRFTGLSYIEITQFLSQIRDEVDAVFAGQQKQK